MKFWSPMVVVATFGLGFLLAASSNFVEAWIVTPGSSASTVMNNRKGILIPSSTTSLYMSTTNETMATKTSSSSGKKSLPDFGKTTIEVDKIKLEKKRRKKKKKKEPE